MEKKEPVFAKGLFWSRPREGAPDYIKGNMSVNVESFITFMKENMQYVSPKGWMSLDLKVSKDGQTLYFQVNTWKPLEKPEALKNNGLTCSEVQSLEALRNNHNEGVIEVGDPFEGTPF